MLCSHLQRHNDKDAGRKTHDKDAGRTSLEKYSPLTLLQGFERVIQGLHVRGCWRPNINFIFWPHCYDRHVVSFLLSWCWGLLHRGVFRGPPRSGMAFPTTSGLWLSGSLLATASGFFRVPPRSGVAFPTTSGLYCLEFYWQLHRGFPRSPSVGCGLPYHISSLTLWESAGNCFGTPNSTELNNNSTPTRSPTGSLNRMFNRHQAEITVIQFRGYSLPVHDCNGTMRPSTCPIL